MLIYSNFPDKVNPSLWDVPQTCMWLKRLALSSCWSEAEAQIYILNFRESGIDGYNLSEITPKVLDGELFVRNPEHRKVIMSSIKKLFPYRNTIQTSRTMGTAESSSSMLTRERVDVFERKRKFLLNFEIQISSSSSMFTYDRVEDPERERKLILTLDPFQRYIGIQKSHIIQEFNKFDFVVSVEDIIGKPALYIIIFMDEQSAKRAHARKESIGFHLKFKRPPRSTGRNPQQYVALERQDIWYRTSAKSIFVGVLNKGSVVTVNKIKKRRARVVDLDNEGATVIKGWVTLQTDYGRVLLKLLE